MDSEMASRAGLSLIITAPGTTSLRELQAILPSNSDVVVSTILMSSVTPEGVMEYWGALDYVLDQVAMAKPKIVGQITVAAALTGDPAGPRALKGRIEGRLEVPAVVAASSCVKGLRYLGVQRPLIVAPYAGDLQRRLIALLRSGGLEPAGWSGPSSLDPGEIHRASAAECRQYVAEGIESHSEADGVFVSGGGWPSLHLVDELEAQYGVPVLTSNIAIAWELACVTGGYPKRKIGALLRDLSHG